MLKLVNVSKYYNTNDMTNLGLHNVNLEFYRNEIVAIVGDSGSGKSTLLNVISKMDSFDEGEIFYKGNETSYFGVDDMDDFRKNKVGFIFQNYNIIDSYTVLENVALPLILKGMTKEAANKRAQELINKVGLKDRTNNRGTQLSGGEKQRCVIARALASDCEILACDEPTGNLDSETSKEIIELLANVASDKLVLIVTHNYDLIKDIATRKIRVHDGEIVEDVELKPTPKEDENIELNLDYVPLKKKIGFKVALNNIFKTPKKTILTSFIFLFISFFLFTLFQAIMYLNASESSYNSFVYKGDDKLIVFDSGNTLDLDYLNSISDKIVVNAFYEEYYAYLSEIGDVNNYNYVCYYGYESYPKNLVLNEGRMPENDDECILLIPTAYKDIKSEYILNHNIEFSNQNSDMEIKIVGYQYRTDVQEVLISHNDKVEAFFRYLTCIKNGLNLSYDNNSFSMSTVFDYSVEKSYIVLSSSYTYDIDKVYASLDYECSTSNKYHIFDNFEINDIRYQNTSTQSMKEKAKTQYSDYLVIGRDIIEETKKVASQASIYGNQKLMAASLDINHIPYLSPKTHSSSLVIVDVLTNLLSYILIFYASQVLVVIFFITYVILSKVYASKKKDYNILRTLGITRKDMRFIVRNEVFTVGMVISILVYLVFVILGKTLVNSDFFAIYNSVTFVSSLIYFGEMLLLILLLSRRFNRKLFKFTVNKSFKNEEVKND